MTVQKTGSCCAGCSGVATKRSRVKEDRVAAFLIEKVKPKYTRWNRENPGATLCGRYRVDFTWELGSGVESTPCRVVLLEVDEHQHNYASYPKACELARMGNIVQGYGGLPVHFIRFNPDEFKFCGITQKNVAESYRLSRLGRMLRKAFANPDFADNLLTIQYHFYDNELGNNKRTLRFKTFEDYVEWMDNELKVEEQNKDLQQASGV